jgi:hypothetical protein
MILQLEVEPITRVELWEGLAFDRGSGPVGCSSWVRVEFGHFI